MISAEQRRNDWLNFALRSPVAVTALAVAYTLAGWAFVFTDYTLNDEGLLTHYWASWARQEPTAIFFLQRLRPIPSLLYSPVSGIGPHWTLAAHVLVSALAIPMIAAVARSFSQRFPNLPALVIGLSPIFFYGGAAGISNNDGVVGICAVLYLLCVRHSPLAAGVLLGLLPWVRFELTLPCLILVGHGLLVRHDRVLVAGAAAFPILYLTGGAIYHQDLAWGVHFPPTNPADPSDPMWQSQLIGLRYLLEPMIAVTPLAPIVLLLRRSRLSKIENTLLVYLIVGVLVMNVFPMFKLFNFGTAPRYSLCLLPSLALLIGRAVESWWDENGAALPWLGILGLTGLWLITRQQDARTVALLISLYAALVSGLYRRWVPGATLMAVLIVGTGPILDVRADVNRRQTAPYLEDLTAWLEAHRADLDKPILTNIALLAAYADTRVPGLDIHFMAGGDMTRDTVLVNRNNGQAEALGRVVHELYGEGIFNQVVPTDYPNGALFVLSIDPRLPMLLPDAMWNSKLQIIAESEAYRIARLPPSDSTTSD